MALPTPDKTWTFPAVNQIVGLSGSSLSDHRHLLRLIKNALLAGVSPWSVAGSSNSVVGAFDGVDRWVVDNNLVWDAAGVAHSWIVLTSTPGPQLCIDCTPLDGTTQGPNLTVVYSWTGAFAGGSNLNRPTAPDEVVLLNGVQWIGTDSTTPTLQTVFHVIRSDDGEAERIIIHYNNIPVAFWFFDHVPQKPVAGWPTPWVAGVVGAENLTTKQTTYARLWKSPALKAQVPGTVGTVYSCSDGWAGYGAGQRLQAANDFTSAWPFFSIAFASETAGLYGRLTGSDPTARGCWDMWFGSTALAEGDTYPAGGTKEFVQFGHLIFPWDGSVPVTA